MNSYVAWIGAVGASGLWFGCVDAEQVPNEGGGGTGGDTEAAAPLHARLFAAGWVGQTETGIQAWDNPNETGIDREPDLKIVTHSALGVAVLGDRLFVASYPENGTCDDACQYQLHVYDGAWELGSDAVPTFTIDFSAAASFGGNAERLTIDRDLDLLSFQGVVFPSASLLEPGAVPVEGGGGVYDSARDRLFVAANDSVLVVEQASTQAPPYTPSWTLHTGMAFYGLAFDGVRLYATGSSDSSALFQVAVWPDVASLVGPAPPAYMLRRDAQAPPVFGSTYEEPFVLKALPVGVIAGTDGSLVAWADSQAIVADGAASANLHTKAPMVSIQVSAGGQIYASAGNLHDEVWAYSSTTLAEQVGTHLGGNSGLFLIER